MEGRKEKSESPKHPSSSAGVLLSFFSEMGKAAPFLRLVLSILIQGRQRNPEGLLCLAL